MKLFATAAVIAAAATAFAQDAAPAPATSPAPTAQAAPKAPAALEDYKAALNQVLDISEALGNSIAEVKDLATADAAADKVAALVAQMQEVKTKAEAMGDPSEEIEQALEAYMETQITRLMEIGLKFQSMGALMDSETPFFGSEKLQKALLPLLMEAMGGAPVDEDEPTTLEEEEEEESPAPEK
ncbi:MAG: hypothetical protein MR890_02690 [Akkermansia muciniphila]|nr:hypothetical protein [Akkermansia muciniphila]